MIKINNFIEANFRKLDIDIKENNEYLDLYKDVSNEKLKLIFSVLHKNFINLFYLMNTRLPTDDTEQHFWADESRQLITTIEVALDLKSKLINSPYEFEIDKYYEKVIQKCNTFLESSLGSTIPPNMEKIDLYYTIPIFKMKDSITIKGEYKRYKTLQPIGQGSFANVYKFEDDFYHKTFALKRLKKNVEPKVVDRFKREYEEMKKLNYPYILEVYNYNEEKNEYIMEFADYTLESYIRKNNLQLTVKERKNIVNQVLKAFLYLHSKRIFHRDISVKNILLKKYDGLLVVKISDFGLVKIVDSTLTDKSTDLKGSFNDPSLEIDGFNNYNMKHEMYALTRLVYFIMTGKTTMHIDKIKNQGLKTFVEKGLNNDKSKRFKDVNELKNDFNKIKF